MDLDQQRLAAINSDNYLVQDGNEFSIVGDGYGSDPYEDNADSPEEKEHGIDHYNVSDDTGYGTLMMLTEVAFNMPVEPDDPRELELEGPVAEPGAPVPMELLDLGLEAK
jgi:hypothetical protein